MITAFINQKNPRHVNIINSWQSIVHKFSSRTPLSRARESFSIIFLFVNYFLYIKTGVSAACLYVAHSQCYLIYMHAREKREVIKKRDEFCCVHTLSYLKGIYSEILGFKASACGWMSVSHNACEQQSF